MNLLSRLALLLFLVSLCLGFTLAFPSVLVTSVLQPIVVSLWLAWRMVTSVDQSTYWALLLLICCVGLVRVLPPGRRGQVAPASGDVQEPIPSISRWQALLRSAQQTGAGETALRASLQELLEEMVGDGEHAAATGLEPLSGPNPAMPPSVVREYLYPTRPTASWLSLERVQALGARFVRWLRRTVVMPTGPDKAAIDNLLGWMETLMEMKHDQ